MVLDILTFPSEVLRQKAKPVDEITDEIRKLIDNMLDTLYDVRGYGLAAPQVGHSLQIFVLDEHAGKKGKNPLVFINPVISEEEGEITEEEGCLSIPKEYAPCKRYVKITVNAINEKGEPVCMTVGDHFARIIQHETDHLNGMLFIDRLPSFRRDTIKKHIKRRLQTG